MIAITNGRPGIGILRACSVSIVIPRPWSAAT